MASERANAKKEILPKLVKARVVEQTNQQMRWICWKSESNSCSGVNSNGIRKSKYEKKKAKLVKGEVVEEKRLNKKG